jgi:3-deoxy-7-phosphoheptulonate synthase
VYKVGDVEIGGDSVFVIAGPCAVESREQLMSTAKAVKASGAHFLRGGAFKPRTSPYTFQGMGLHGLKLLEEARAATGLPVITEVMAPHDVEAVATSADILQIGARNMQNYNLLFEVGQVHKPVMLKRGLSATIEEWLLAAEYILSRGNYQVILCERGIRTYETMTRNTLDLNAVPVVRELSHLPIVVDPSHGTGSWRWVQAMACAGVAAGAHGLMIEVHPNPAEAYSDGPQSLKFDNFARLMTAVQKVSEAVGRSLA